MRNGYSTDLALINKFQKASDWVQGNFGFNNFAIAKLLRIAMVIALLLRIVVSFLHKIDATEIIIVSCSAMVIIKMEMIAKHAKRSLKNKDGLMNPVANEYAGARVIIQFVSLASFAYLIVHLYNILNPSFLSVIGQYDEWKELCWDIFGILLVPVAYFSSCTPKPYNPGRIKKYTERKLGQRVVPLTLKRTL